MDLTRGSSHDHVDNPFWSVFQIKIKSLTSTGPSQSLTTIGDADLGKVNLLGKLYIHFLIGSPLCEPDM